MRLQNRQKIKQLLTEAALKRNSKENVFWKYAVNLPENTGAKV